eukprot:TRINITY_DN25810_c1_g1_i1.p1 TRINITY_DN25810_c1_g1~~TRINITY_DN25810_c1_g1_i1.p1  ORF type:complete len:185 (+),score=20.57 TRINITY_DN25810_c1_g1_i1:49-603(+)
MCGLGCTKFFNIVLSLTGIGLSGYALYIEHKASKDQDYEPLCDIDEDISCSAVFTSQYARGFGLVAKYLGEDHPLNEPNAMFGVAFYTLMLLLSLLNYRFIATLQVMLSFGACAMSCYLGYLLYFVIKSLCVVCVSTYVVNFFLLVFSVCKRRALAPRVLKENRYGYYIPTTNTPSNNNFKKFI